MKKTLIGIVVLIIICIMTFVCVKGILSAKKNKEITEMQKQLNDYRNAVVEYKSVIIESLYNLEAIGNLEASYWHDYIYNNKFSSPSDATDNAKKAKENEVQLIKSQRWEIDSKYINTQNIPNINNDTVIQLKAKCKELYESYYDLYYCVLTPKGNYSEFTNEFSTIDREGAKISREVDVLATVLLRQSLALNNK